MSDKLETEFSCNPLLQRLDVLVGELDDPAGLDVDEVIMMAARGLFVMAAAVSEIMALKNPLVGEKLERAINRRKRNPGIDAVCTPVHFLDIGVIRCQRQHARDGPALAGHPQAMLGASGFNAR